MSKTKADISFETKDKKALYKGKVDINTPDLSEMMRHYLSVQEKYPDCVVFYRLGDFYEMFFDTAVEVSELLELTLTGRECGLKEGRAPMCGIPYHAADSYIAKLVSLGKKVAICEQLSDPKESKGLVDRDVIRVVTGGTVTEDDYVDQKSNNYILAVSKCKTTFSVSWADITTGDFFCQTVATMDDVLEVFQRVDPAEIIADEVFMEEYSALTETLRNNFVKPRSYSEKAFEPKNAERLLCEQLSVKDVTDILPPENVLGACAAGAVIAYLRETQKHSIENIRSLICYDDGKYLKLDGSAIRNLEIIKSMRDGKRYGSLLWAVDKTKTAGGGRRIKRMLLSPLHDIDAINYRLDGVEELFNDNLARKSIEETLSSVYDLARLCGRISNGIVTPRNCREIMLTLECVPTIKVQLAGVRSEILSNVFTALGDFSEIEKLIRDIINDNPPVSSKEGGFVKPGFDKNLDYYRDINKNANERIKEIEERERNATGIRTLKIGYNKVFGYYIEVSNSFVNQVPYHYIRKQTLVNGERYVTEELKRFEEEVFTSRSNIIQIESDIFEKLKLVLTENLDRLLSLARAISTLDVLCSFASVARQRNYCRPSIVAPNEKMNIVGGRHPVIEANGKVGFIANDTYLDVAENSMMIITGPNMAGKSTYMRQVALITLLAHVGSFVPAKEAEIPLVDRIFTRVGASDNLMFDQSTFMVEMTEVANVLKHATKESLVILDEVGRGTSTYDGLSIAWAVVEYLTTVVKAKTLFATHYHELSELENTLDGVKNYKVSVRERDGEIVFLRKVVQGSTNKSFGIEVASLAGVPEVVTQKAKRILKSLEKNDIALNGTAQTEEITAEKASSFVEDYLKRLDINNVTPLKAFEILNYLKEKANGED